MSFSNASVSPQMAGTVTKANGTFGTNSFPNSQQGTYSYTVGSGAAQANNLYAASGTVNAGTPVTLDLVSGLTDPVGTSIVFTDIVALGIYNNSSTAGQNISWGGGTSCVSSIIGTATMTILPGGSFVTAISGATGYAINSTTAHFLNINVASGTAVPYSIFILGH